MAKEAKRSLTYGLYAALMEELKVRLRTIDTVFLQENAVHGTINREICFLQLRLSCEVLALACLVAHGDILGTRAPKFQRRYEADWIMSRLTEAHPDFYPHAVRHTKVAPNEHHFSDFAGPVLTKDALIRLYAECGSILHRGDMRKLLSTDEPLSSSVDDAKGYVSKLWNLLLQHRIALSDGRQLVCFLEDPLAGGAARVTIGSIQSHQ